MMHDEPKAMMLRIAADYEKLAEWAEKDSRPSSEKFIRTKSWSKVVD
jgi:hypothetical protein